MFYDLSQWKMTWHFRTKTSPTGRSCTTNFVFGRCSGCPVGSNFVFEEIAGPTVNLPFSTAAAAAQVSKCRRIGYFSVAQEVSCSANSSLADRPDLAHFPRKFNGMFQESAPVYSHSLMTIVNRGLYAMMTSYLCSFVCRLFLMQLGYCFS